MSHYQTLVIGCFIIAAAHYVRDGAALWYALWVLAGVALNFADRHLARLKQNSDSGEDHTR